MEKLSDKRIKLSNPFKSGNMESTTRGSLFHGNLDIIAVSSNWKTVSPAGIIYYSLTCSVQCISLPDKLHQDSQ